jgi:hypothetical protein
MDLLALAKEEPKVFWFDESMAWPLVSSLAWPRESSSDEPMALPWASWWDAAMAGLEET